MMNARRREKMMNDKTFKSKINRDVDKVKKDVVTLGEDSVAGLTMKFDQWTDEKKDMVTDAVKNLNKDITHGLSQYNAKVQDVADRLPGGFGKKAAKYPWVSITMTLAFGLLLGGLLKPGRRPLDSSRQEKLVEIPIT